MADHLRYTAAAVPRRKVRKGTHSCWECRRRKIRCQFNPSNESVCLPCEERGSLCRSQEYIDSARPPQAPDRSLAQRLSHLEDLMTKLVDRVMPEESPGVCSAPEPSRRSSPASSHGGLAAHCTARPRDIGIVDSLPAEKARTEDLLGSHGIPPATNSSPQSVGAFTPHSEPIADQGPPGTGISSHAEVCQTLHMLFPSQQDVTTIVQATAAPYFLTSLFNSSLEVTQDRSEPPHSVRTIPPATSHPTVLAKRLLQLSICIQQQQGSGDRNVRLKKPLKEHMFHIITTVSQLVTSNDDLIGTAEGLQSLVLLGYWHSNAGNLRKAWLTFRRAMSLGQLMGIDRGGSRSFQFADPTMDHARRPTPQGLWYRINSCDRSLSLMLGLPVGSTDNGFATEESMRQDTPMERLAKLHTVISKRVLEQSRKKSGQAYAMTRIIDGDLTSARVSMDQDWWTMPRLDPDPSTITPRVANQQMTRMLLQIQHFDLRMILHLPYVLRSPGESTYDDSKAICTQSSREVLQRFVAFRAQHSSPWTCRHVDYSALLAGMTLLLSYLCHLQHRSEALLSLFERPDEDRKLIEAVRERMQHVAVMNHDRLSQESANIIDQMLPVLDSANVSRAGSGSHFDLGPLQIDVPHFGAVNIRARTSPSLASKCTPPGSNALDDDMSQDTGFLPAVAADNPTRDPAGLMRLDLAPAEPPLPDFDTAFQGMYMQVDPSSQGDMTDLAVVADAEGWVFQGVESSYWSLLNLEMPEAHQDDRAQAGY